MPKEFTQEQLLIPIYINEKIILDMLAIMEDGFSKVSQVSSSELVSSSNEKAGTINGSTSLLNKLFKIELNGELSGTKKIEGNESISKEKVHTNTSLLSKFRTTLTDNKILDMTGDISNMKIGMFVEMEGELQKNPLIDYMDKFVDIFRMANIFADPPALGNKKSASVEKDKNQHIVKQITDFSSELKNSGTIDFIMTNDKGKVVLSAQEQYLANDNISEMLGGKFKVLGKVISVCKDSSTNIDLLRKTIFSILTDKTIEDMFSGLKESDGE
ncbi:MAG: hypothetical protein LUE29_04930 [Lachnospiraceae bacterium]|nr:hypothetical protein [Lachnospiraceae bacterium]